VGFIPQDYLIAMGRLGKNCGNITLGAGCSEYSSFLTHSLRRHDFQAVNCRVFTIDVIADFGTAADIIDYAAALTIVTYTPAVATVAAIDAEGIATFHADDDILFLLFCRQQQQVDIGMVLALTDFLAHLNPVHPPA
jgi:hypothetical protein